MSRLSRRELFQASAVAGLAASAAQGVRGDDFAAPLQVGAGAGPPPLGAPVEASVPLPAGKVHDPGGWAILSAAGRPMPAQMRPASHWPDGSIRWLAVAFEAESGPGAYRLAEGAGPQSSPLLTEENGTIRIDTGGLSLAVHPRGWIETPLTGPLCCDLWLTRHDGKIFRASLDNESRVITIEERGPVRCALRMAGVCRADDGTRLFDYILRLTAFRMRPELHVTVTWINATGDPGEQLRDIRMTVPFGFLPERLAFGCDGSVYDGPYVKGWPVFLLQEDHDRYWAKTLNPDGRVQHLASGGANGGHCPGWLYAAGAQRCLGVWVPNFWQEYPNEISVRDGELSIGLWPQRAASHLAGEPVLPRNPFGGRPYHNTKYWPVMPHPYVAFLDAERRCLDVPQGLAKTQDIILSFWTGNGESTFERKYWSGSLAPVRAHAAPRWVASSGAAGAVEPADPARFGKLEQLYRENFEWFERHASVFRAYGKFDYGDFRYFTAASDYLCTPGTKWGEMGEMAREGYWHNNERDPLRGLLLYYLRTGNPSAWSLSRAVARHLFDVDIRHHPHWGMWTHSYGHCYLGLGEGGEPDHSWLAGMLLWAQITGDAVALAQVTRCADGLLDWHPDFARTDARSVSVFVHVMCQFHAHAGEPKYLEAARPAVQALLKLQSADGGWPAYLGDLSKPRIEGFVEHAALALADWYAITNDEPARAALDRALERLFPRGADWKADTGESPLALHALAILAAKTSQPDYASLARQILEKLHASLNLSSDPRIRGDLWAAWGENLGGGARVPGRPPQFLGQTRPLAPASILAYGQQCLASVARLGGNR